MKSENAEIMTRLMAGFISHNAKILPDDVLAKLSELRQKEDSQPARLIYDTMFENLRLAKELDRPCCQDTGAIQFWVRCGTNFSLINELPDILREAVLRATKTAPLRHNCVETFAEYNTGTNTGNGIPTILWDIVPGSDRCEIFTYMAGGGCTLPGRATVLMPGEGYEGVVRFVLDTMTKLWNQRLPSAACGGGCGDFCGNSGASVKKGAYA